MVRCQAEKKENKKDCDVQLTVRFTVIISDHKTKGPIFGSSANLKTSLAVNHNLEDNLDENQDLKEKLALFKQFEAFFSVQFLQTMHTSS